MKKKQAVIVVNTYKEEARRIAEEVRSFLSAQNVSSDLLEFTGSGTDVSFEPYDFAVTLGGDGTVLFAARNCLDLGIPLFPAAKKITGKMHSIYFCAKSCR